MNFKEWYNQPSIRNNYNIIDAQNSWNACKSEILKLLKKRTDHIEYYRTDFKFIDIDVIKEIEKL